MEQSFEKWKAQVDSYVYQRLGMPLSIFGGAIDMMEEWEAGTSSLEACDLIVEAVEAGV